MSDLTPRQIIADLERIPNPNGIQESFKASIGGIPQWVFTRGQDKSNPILILAHGGPAAPLSIYTWMFQRPIEEYFTVVNWDQRAAGKTYLETNPESLRDTLRVERFIDDILELAELVAQRYGAKKVVLAAHSWGTIISLPAVLKKPDLFSAYVGIGQIINGVANERASFDLALAEAKKHENAEAISELGSVAPYPGDIPVTAERIGLVRKWAQHYGGFSAFRETNDYFFFGPEISPAYTDAEVDSLDPSGMFSMELLLDQMVAADYSAVTTFPVPIFMFMGRHDYYTPPQEIVAWFEKLDAPVKKGVWFENSAHMIPWEEPGKLLMSLVHDVRPFAVTDTK